MKFTAFIPSRLRRPISGYINWAFVWDPVSHVASAWFLQSKPLCYPCLLARPFTGKDSLFLTYNSFCLPFFFTVVFFLLKMFPLFLLHKRISPFTLYFRLETISIHIIKNYVLNYVAYHVTLL